MTREEAGHLLALSREADFFGPDQAQWLERLSPQRQQVEEAARFFLDAGDDDAAAELAANLWRLWSAAGDVAGGRRFVAAALSGEGKPSRARALALYGDGVLAFRAGEQAESKARNAAALEAAQAVGDKEAEALALVGLSRVAFRDGDYERVRSLATQARELTRGLAADAGTMPLHMLAAGSRLSGALDEAVELYTESLELNRRLGDSYMVAVELHNLGHVELHRGNTEAAERYFAECAPLRSGGNPYDVAMAALNAAAMAWNAGDRARAAELLGTVETTLAEAGITLDPDDRFEVDWLRDRVG